MDFLGILGIAAGFALLMLLTYRGWSVYLASFAGAAVVVLCAGLPLAETLTQKYIGGIGSIVTSLLGMFLFSSVMAQLYADSGAAASLSRAMQRLFLRGPLGPRGRRRMSLLVVIFASALICYGGVNAAVVIITVYPIALSVFESCGIPRRFVPGVLLGGCVTFALSGPGSPQPTNLIPASLLGTSPAAGLVPGLAGMAVEVVVCLLVLDWMIERAVRRGETFEPAAQPDAAASAQVRRPPAALALAPLAVLFLLFNLAGLDILLCTLAGAVCAAVLFYPWLDGYRALRRCINEGLASSLAPVGSIGAVCGFAACVQSVPVFERLVDAIVHWSIDPYLLCMVSVALLCALTGGSTTGQSIALPIVAPLLESRGMAPAVIHRVAAFSATTLDSLPYSGTILMTVHLSGVRMKDAYPAIFVSTTLATAFASATVTALLWLFPALA